MERSDKKHKGLDIWFRQAQEDGIIGEKNPTKTKEVKESPKLEGVRPVTQNNPTESPLEMDAHELTRGIVIPLYKGCALLNQDKLRHVVSMEDGWVTTKRGLRFPFWVGQVRGYETARKEKITRNVFIPLSKERTVGYRISKEYPCVEEWLNSLNAKSTRKIYTTALRDFCLTLDIKPSEFGDLYKTIQTQIKAKVVATKYIKKLIEQGHINRAYSSILGLKSFFNHYSGGFVLPLDTKGALKITVRMESKGEKPRYSWGTHDEIREKMAIIIPSCSRDLLDKMALTMLFRAGIRGNVLDHIKVKHVQDIIEVENKETGKKEDLLCLTVTGYDPETDEGLDLKILNYKFPRLADTQGQPRGYYTYLSGDSLELFKKFMRVYHKHSDPETYLFEILGAHYRQGLQRRFNDLLEKNGYPSKLITLHQFRACFDDLAMEVLKSPRAKMLCGHLLGKVEEAYHKRNKIQCAMDYLKIKFLPIPERMKEVEKRLHALEEGRQLAQEESEALRIKKSREASKKREKEPSESEVVTPTQVSEKGVVSETTEHWEGEATTFMDKKRKRETMDELLNRICFKEVRAFGSGRQIACVKCKNAWDRGDRKSPYPDCKKAQNRELAKLAEAESTAS